MFNIERFRKAQDREGMYETALQEIKDGRKRSHWIWYVFPQIEGLGHSEMSRCYSIGSLLEAKVYLEDPVLCGRMYEAIRALEEVHDRHGYSMEEIFGELDAMKVLSCMTLFNYVSPDSAFKRVIHYCYDDRQCKLTRAREDTEYEWIRASAFERHELMIDEKALLESGSYESGQYSFEQRFGTLLDMFQKGERMNQMVQHYLWSRDCSSYRTSGVESTITHMAVMFLYELLAETKDEEQRQPLAMYIRRMNDADDVLQAAIGFDNVFYEVTKNPAWQWIVDKYVSESLLKG